MCCGEMGGRLWCRSVELRRHETRLAELSHILHVYQLAGPENGHSIADFFHLRQDVRGKKNALSFLSGVSQLGQELMPHGRIERVRRLIEDQKWDLRNENLQEGHFTLHSRGEARNRSLQVDFQSPRQAIQLRINRLTAQPAQESDELPPRHVLI